MRVTSLAVAATIVASALAAGCSGYAGSGLTSARPSSYAPRTADTGQPQVYGKRLALSDAREQPAARTPSPPAAPASGREAERRGPAAARSTHESVDTGRARVLAEARKEETRAGRTGPAPPAAPTAAPAAARDGTIVVEAGDTLLKIATRHRVSVAALMSANRLSSLTVEPGQRLVIPKR